MNTKSLIAAVLLACTPGFTHSAFAQDPNAAPPVPAAAGTSALETRVFKVPPDFLTRGKGGDEKVEAAADPFAAAPAPKISPDEARQALESLGIQFLAEGSTASFDEKSGRLVVKNLADQLDTVEVLVSGLDPGLVREGLVHLEAFSLPPLAARKALIAQPKEAALYAWLDAEMAKKDSIVRLERDSVTRVRGGQRSKTEGIDEYAFPTEFDPPQIPQTISLPVGATGSVVPGTEKVFAPWPITSTTPTSFTFRSTGWTVETEVTFMEDGKSVDVNLAPVNTRVAATVRWGLPGEVFQPVFETQRSLTQVSMRIGQPTLVSTFSPPVNTGVPGGNKDDRVWLLFVTVTVPK